MEHRSQPQPATKVPISIHAEEEAGPGPRFAKTSFLMSWLAQAAQLRGKAIHVACLPIHRSSILGSTGIQLPGSLLASLGISQDATSCGLRQLALAGLVRLRRRVGHRPLVELVVASAPDLG